MVENDLQAQDNHQIVVRKPEHAEDLYGIVSRVFDVLNTIPVQKRMERTSTGIVPIERHYTKKDSKYKIPTNVRVQIGRWFDYEEDIFKDGINDFSVLVNTGEMNLFAQSAYSYRLMFHRTNHEISIEIGRGIFSRNDFDYPTILEVVFDVQGNGRLGDRTDKDWLEREDVEGLVKGIDNLVHNFVPLLVEGFASDVTARIRLREPKQIQASLQILEDMLEKSPYDSDLEALYALTKDKHSSDTLPDGNL